MLELYFRDEISRTQMFTIHETAYQTFLRDLEAGAEEEDRKVRAKELAKAEPINEMGKYPHLQSEVRKAIYRIYRVYTTPE
jgi:hypothetical protein